ncbi:hypothetical protein [Actinoplanes sp. L3-i22]|uniref:hypothetical protein n=1 Tax=Actinoplanes sp. L3-i22 TaxID=2836373 RepID=UPI001C756B73|nr:hypothetical protein [Actinoplanes sp. L3-i22]BCY14182.1 hypothetical protein L3i22_092700 [Actinoplanes sp. L3-i22]
MNANELDARLRAAGVDRATYRIEGVAADGGLIEGGWILGPAGNGGWSLRTWERGQEWPDEEFANEDEACRWFYNLIVNKKRST